MFLRALLASAAILGAGRSHHPAESLPLTRGVYVDVGTSCRGAATSERSWFGGGDVIQASHAHCDALSASRKGPARYLVVNLCRAEGAAASYRVVDRITVVSSTEFELENRFGRFHARWCRE